MLYNVQGKILYQEMSAKSMQASEHGDDKSTRIENDINTRPGLWHETFLSSKTTVIKWNY